MNEFFEYFAGGGFPITSIILVMAVVFVFIVLLMYIPVLTRKIFPRFYGPAISTSRCCGISWAR